MEPDALKYPIGRYVYPKEITTELLDKWKEEIINFPGQLQKEVQGLSDNQLDTQYRPNGWTVRQVIHHLAESNMVIFIWLRVALTQEKPHVQFFSDEDSVGRIDYKTTPIESSIKIIEGVSNKFVEVLEKISSKELKRTFRQPEVDKDIEIKEFIGMYTWHSYHHLAQITALKKRQGWN